VCNRQEGEEQFMLLGLVLGLAIYNRVLLDFPLPLALYKKLLVQVRGWHAWMACGRICQSRQRAFTRALACLRKVDTCAFSPTHVVSTNRNASVHPSIPSTQPSAAACGPA